MRARRAVLRMEPAQIDAVAEIKACVLPEFQEAALLSHREVCDALSRLRDRGDLKMEAAVQKAARLLGLDRDVLGSVLMEGLGALECPRDGFHFEVLSERAGYVPAATKKRKGGR